MDSRPAAATLLLAVAFAALAATLGAFFTITGTGAGLTTWRASP